jgi:ubiquitin C-terminal hydrolase
MDTDELNKNEKFHNISQIHYRLLSFKNLNGNGIKTIVKGKNKCEIQNKENEKEKKEGNKEEIDNYKKEEIKKYIFNNSQLSINLENFEGQSLKPIGLFNPSIYCFMICILQALLSIPELNYFFLSRFYLKNYSKKSKNENETVLCDIFHDFIQSYMFGKKYIELPKILRTVCIRLLGGMRMHDCQEFFVCFLEALQDELNNKEKLNVPENASMKLRWTLYRQINNSFIDSIFTGLMRSAVQCRKCNYKSYTYDPFIDLSVSINKYKNLEKCLKQYFENEKMDCEYKCEKCKQVSKVSKFKYLN